MDDICRLCCSTNFVNNYIFDEENALFLKMSMYLPIKVFKNDRLPKKICDKCSCKVNDFYQFCNETIEVENRLRKLLSSELTITIKRSEEVNRRKSTNNYEFSEQSTQTEDLFDVKVKEETIKSPIIKQETDSNDKNVPDNVSDSDDNLLINIKKKISPIIEQETDTNDENVPHNASDSDNILLINIKKSKKLKKKSERNGHVKKQVQKKRDGIKAQLLRTDCKESKLNLDLVNDESDDDYNHLEEIEKEMFYCCICLFKCAIKIDMLQHYKTHVDQTEKLKPPSPPPLPAESRCDRCQKIISDPKSWKSHWQRHWTQDRRPYHCSLCENSFKGHRQILEHGLTHKLEYENPNRTNEADKRFVCDLCPKGFVYMRYLWAHRRNTHPNAPSRELRCTLCSRTFLHVNSFRRHLRSHSGVRDYLCNVCGKAFASPEHLKFHIRMHTGYKPNICKTCGKGFGKKDSLTMHERVHSGEKPYVCSHCGKAFSQRSTLVIHGRSHSGARPYKCGRCGRGFVAQGLLTMHLKTPCLDLPPPTARKTQSRKVKRVNVKLLEKS